MNKIHQVKNELDSIAVTIRSTVRDLRALVDDTDGNFTLGKSDEHIISVIDNTCNRLTHIVGQI